MRELGIAVGLFALLAAASFAIQHASWMFLLYAGVFLVVGGLLFSLPCAIRYHFLLYASLAPRGALDKRWLWNPTGHHPRLTPAERRRVLPWFYAGAAGWGVSLLGCALAGIAAIASR